MLEMSLGTSKWVSDIVSLLWCMGPVKAMPHIIVDKKSFSE